MEPKLRTDRSCFTYGRRRLSRRHAYGILTLSPTYPTRVQVQLRPLNFDVQASFGEVTAVNYSQHVAAKTSPPRTKRVFVLADASRLRTPTFAPTSTEKAFSGNSPTKSRSQKRDHHASNIAQIGVRSRDDATFLALLHIEPLVDRDLFRCAYCARAIIRWDNAIRMRI